MARMKGAQNDEEYTHIGVSLPKSMVLKIQQAADLEDRSVSNFVRRLLQEHLDKEK